MVSLRVSNKSSELLKRLAIKPKNISNENNATVTVKNPIGWGYLVIFLCGCY
jgi:hypothetical protein